MNGKLVAAMICLVGLPMAAHAAIVIPSTFEAEDFDQGPFNGVGYYDKTPGNQGDAGYRTSEDVDIFVSNDPAGGGRIIKNFENGEWLAYTIDVPTAGNYDIELRAATNSDYNSGYYVVVDDVNVGSAFLGNTFGWDRYAWLGRRPLSLTAGTHVLKIVCAAQYFALNSIRITATVPSTPYYGAPIAVPGEFEAEAFDRGGEAVAYHAYYPLNSGNSGFRDGEDVDIFVSNDADSGSPYVVHITGTEWLAYTVNVASAGNYDIELRAQAHAGGGPFADPLASYQVGVDRTTDATGRHALPDTGNGYEWVGRATLALPAGIHTLTIELETSDILLNTIRITPTGSTAEPPRAIPGVIEAEDFDTGGEGPGYHDNTPGNQGNAGFRTAEDVDIFGSNDSGSGSWYIVKNFEAGEWLAYTISVPTSGNYDVDLRAATHPAFPDSSYYIVIDDVNVTGNIVLPDTGGWDNYQWIGKRTIALTAGTHLLKLVSVQPYFGLNSFRVLHSTP